MRTRDELLAMLEDEQAAGWTTVAPPPPERLSFVGCVIVATAPRTAADRRHNADHARYRRMKARAA